MKIQLMKKDLYRAINKFQFSYKFKTIFQNVLHKGIFAVSCLYEPLKAMRRLEWTKSQNSISNGGTSDV